MTFDLTLALGAAWITSMVIAFPIAEKECHDANAKSLDEQIKGNFRFWVCLYGAPIFLILRALRKWKKS